MECKICQGSGHRPGSDDLDCTAQDCRAAAEHAQLDKFIAPLRHLSATSLAHRVYTNTVHTERAVAAANQALLHDRIAKLDLARATAESNVIALRKMVERMQTRIIEILLEKELAANAPVQAQPVADAAPVGAKPFMYAIMEPGGAPYMDEFCVSVNAEDLHSTLNGLNDSPDTGYQIVPVYTPSQPSPAQDDALDAARWRAFIGSERIKPQGSAGLESSTDPNGNPFGDYAHMGLEIWTTYSRDFKPEMLDQMDKTTALGRKWLTAYADVAIRALAAKPAEGGAA